MERDRRGKAYRARTGSVTCWRRAVRRPLHPSPGNWGPLPGHRHEAAPDRRDVPPLRRRRRRHRGPGPLAAPPGAVTRTGEHRWDRSVIWGMLRNPALSCGAVFGKTQVITNTALNRIARLQGRTVPRQVKTVRPAAGGMDHDPRPGPRGRGHLRPRAAAARKTTSRSPPAAPRSRPCCRAGRLRPPAATADSPHLHPHHEQEDRLLRAWAPTTTATKAAGYARSKPVRADYLDRVVWDHIVCLLADPALIRAEIRKKTASRPAPRPAHPSAHTIDWPWPRQPRPSPRWSRRLQQLITIDELRAECRPARPRNEPQPARRPGRRAADRDAYLKLPAPEGFLPPCAERPSPPAPKNASGILRLLVKDVLVGPEKITIRHRIPVRRTRQRRRPPRQTDTEGDMRQSYPLRWGRDFAVVSQPVHALRVRPLDGPGVPGLPVRALRG